MDDYEHQQEGINFICSRPVSALYFDTGTGKTRILIRSAEIKKFGDEVDNLLVVSTQEVIEQWRDKELPIHAESEYATFLWSSARTKTEAEAREYFLYSHDQEDVLRIALMPFSAFSTNYAKETFVDRYAAQGRLMIIIDECTALSSAKTRWTRRIKSIEAEHKVMASGSPLSRKPFGLHSQFDFLVQDFFGVNYSSFCAYFGMKCSPLWEPFARQLDAKTWSQIRREASKIDLKDNLKVSALLGKFGITREVFDDIMKANYFSPYRRLDELQDLIKDFAITKHRSECIDLPERIFTPTILEPTPQQKELYEQMRDEMILEYADKELTAANKMVLAMRLKQITSGFINGESIPNNPKFEYIVEAVKAESDQLIIWSCYVADIEALTDALPDCAALYGGTPNDKRAEVRSAFQDGSLQTLVIGLQMSRGLNFQNCSHAMFYSNSFSTEERIQALGRTNRLGSKKPCVYKDLAISGTIDEQLVVSLQNGVDLDELFKKKLEEVL